MKLRSIVLALFVLFAMPALSKPRHHPSAQRLDTAEYWDQFAVEYKWKVIMPTIAAAQAWLPPPDVYKLWNRALWDSR